MTNPYLLFCLALIILCAVTKAKLTRRLQFLRVELSSSIGEEQKIIGQYRQLEAEHQFWKVHLKDLSNDCQKLEVEMGKIKDEIERLEEKAKRIRTHQHDDFEEEEPPS